MTDEFTLRRAQKGDPQAFERLVTPHEQTVWRVCWHYTHHTEDAKDCMQEAMLKAWRAIGQYRGDCALETWLYRIASTVCLDFLRRQKRLTKTHLMVQRVSACAAEPPRPVSGLAECRHWPAAR